jgi:hypothetical protein
MNALFENKTQQSEIVSRLSILKQSSSQFSVLYFILLNLIMNFALNEFFGGPGGPGARPGGRTVFEEQYHCFSMAMSGRTGLEVRALWHCFWFFSAFC